MLWMRSGETAVAEVEQGNRQLRHVGRLHEEDRRLALAADGGEGIGRFRLADLEHFGSGLSRDRQGDGLGRRVEADGFEVAGAVDVLIGPHGLEVVQEGLDGRRIAREVFRGDLPRSGLAGQRDFRGQRLLLGAWREDLNIAGGINGRGRNGRIPQGV